MNKLPDLMHLLRPQLGQGAGRVTQVNDPGQGAKGASGPASVMSGDTVSLRSPLQVAMRSLADSVFKNLPFSGQPLTVSQGAEEDRSGFDYELVANNVSNFVEAAVRQAKERGESDDYLQNMIAQARIGVERGFGEAKDELEDMGMLSDDLAEGIDKSYGLIQQRINDFEKDLFAEEADLFSATQVTLTQSHSTQSYSSGGDFSGAKMVGQASAYRIENSASLALTTQEGDKVTISFNGLQASSLGVGFASKGNAETLLAQYSNQHSFGFSFSVEGDLSEEEMVAMTDFINQVATVSDAFFAGDFDLAFDNAKKLGFDDAHIASFALNFEQTQSVAVTKVYKQVQGDSGSNNAGQPASLFDMLEPLSEYIRQFKELVEQSESLFANYDGGAKQRITQVADQILPFLQPDSADASQRFQQFNERLLSALTQLEQPPSSPAQ